MQELFEKLQSLRSLKKNWDSYSADPPNERSITNAHNFLSFYQKSISHNNWFEYKVTATVVGGVGFCAQCLYNNRTAYIEFTNDGLVHMMLSYHNLPDEFKSDDSTIVVEKVERYTITCRKINNYLYDAAVETDAPRPKNNGSLGCGESLKYQSDFYYYKTPCAIPRDKPALLCHEGTFLGRVHGEKNYILVAWNGFEFEVLEHPEAGKTKAATAKYTGLTAKEAIKLGGWATTKYECDSERYPCQYCGDAAIRFFDDQPDGVCSECHRNPANRSIKNGPI